MKPLSTTVFQRIVVKTEMVGGQYDTYLYSLRTGRTYTITTATSPLVAVENHGRLTDTVRDVLYRRALKIASSIPGQMSLIYE